MYDLYLQLLNAPNDTVYNQIVKDNSSVFYLGEDGFYDMIIQDCNLASKLSSNGAIKIGEFVYIFEKDAIYKYSVSNSKYNFVDKYTRKKKGLKSTLYYTDDWNYMFDEVMLSDVRKVIMSMYVEMYGDFVATIGGRTKYYKYSLGKW